MTAGGSWKPPSKGRLYEVYVELQLSDTLHVNGRDFAFNGDVYSRVFPANFAVDPTYVTGWAPSGSPVRYDADNSAAAYFIGFSTSPEGWKFTGDQTLTAGSAFVVIWRDITEERQLS